MSRRSSGGPDLRAFGATDVGRRRSANEDRFHADVARGIFVVVDGVGGQAAGDKAADMAIGAIIERLERETGTVPDRLREAITIANNAVYRAAASRPDWRGMACVATALVVDGDRAVVGHVGDSRLYRLLDGVIEKVTPDHSPVGEREDANEMSELEAMRHPRRNEVYRDIGSEPRDMSDVDFVFVGEIDFPPGAALLLCSDGLTDLVPSEAIRQVATAHAGSQERLVRALIAAANEAGGKDNITAVYVERLPEGTLPAPPVPPGLTGRRTARRLTVGLAVATAVLAGFWLGLHAAGRGWSLPGVLGPPATPGTILVRPGQSIMAALTDARPGTVVTVEPGEYRERLTLRAGVRLLSRVPRGAVIRPPEDGSEGEAAVVADGIGNAELSGFRIVGDTVSPLGVGIITRDSNVRLVDLDISGALTAALDVGTGEGVVVSGSFIHDNPGAALVIRAGAAPRIANMVFWRNGEADALAASAVVEPGAAPVWSQNVFKGISPDSIAGLDAGARAALSIDNWFVALPREAVPAIRDGAPGH